jgi:hypothetical protein
MTACQVGLSGVPLTGQGQSAGSPLPGVPLRAQEMDEEEERYWNEQAGRAGATRALATLRQAPQYRRQFGAKSLRSELDTKLRSVALENAERLAELVGGGGRVCLHSRQSTHCGLEAAHTATSAMQSCVRYLEDACTTYALLLRPHLVHRCLLARAPRRLPALRDSLTLRSSRWGLSLSWRRGGWRGPIANWCPC